MVVLVQVQKMADLRRQEVALVYECKQAASDEARHDPAASASASAASRLDKSGLLRPLAGSLQAVAFPARMQLGLLLIQQVGQLLVAKHAWVDLVELLRGAHPGGVALVCRSWREIAERQSAESSSNETFKNEEPTLSSSRSTCHDACVKRAGVVRVR